MLLDMLKDTKEKGKFSKEFMATINKSYISECERAYNKYVKELKVLQERWYKVTLEAGYDGIGYTDYDMEEIEEVYQDILSLHKESINYILSKMDIDYDIFKEETKKRL